MAINTTVEPFIQRMLQQPDAKGVADGITKAVSNFSGAYLARKEIDREEAAKPEGQRMGGMERFAKAFLGSEGQQRMGANPVVELQRNILRREDRLGAMDEKTMNDIVGQNPVKVAREAGDLRPSQIPEWLAKNSALRVTKWGKAIWDGVAGAYSESETAKINTARAQALGKLSLKYPSLNVGNPDDLSKMRKNESVETLYERAKANGKVLTELPDDWFFDDGTINEQKAVPGLGALAAPSPVVPNIPGMEPSRVTVGPRGTSVTFETTEQAGTRTGVLPEIERIFEQAEKDGTPFTPASKEMARKIRLGLEGREGVDKPKISESEYVAKNLQAFLKTKPTKEVSTTNWRGKPTTEKAPMTEDDAIAALQKQYRNIFGSSDSSASAAPVESSNEVIRITGDGKKAVFDSITKKFLRYAD